MFRAYGADFVDAKGNVTVKGNAKVHQALEYAVKLAEQLGTDVYSYDDASNNRALISGKSALIFNPPSAWAVAVRDNPSVGAGLLDLQLPRRPGRPLRALFAVFLGHLVVQLEQERGQGPARIPEPARAVRGDGQRDLRLRHPALPEHVRLTTCGTKVQPPLGTVFNYPIRPWHDAERSIAAYPAPPDIAVQIYNQGTMTNMIAQVTQQKKSLEQAMAWAQNEIEGYVR